MLPKLTVQTLSSKHGARKSRSFEARLLAYITADRLSEFGTTLDGTRRPVWLAYVATAGASNAFTANLRGARTVQVQPGHERLQLPKTAGHRWVSQPVPGGIATLAYLPDLFHLQPPRPFVEDARFILAPARAWIERQAADLDAQFGDESADAAHAALFAAYLDRRTPLPLLRDLRFHLLIYRAALAEGWTTLLEPGSTSAGAYGLPNAGLDSALACAVDADTLRDFLAAHTDEFRRRYPEAMPPPQAHPRLHPPAELGPLQLSLDLLGSHPRS